MGRMKEREREETADEEVVGEEVEIERWRDYGRRCAQAGEKKDGALLILALECGGAGSRSKFDIKVRNRTQ
jgi:hypothetical protein